jgi:formate dehydrogenase maturation protein FdhE
VSTFQQRARRARFLAGSYPACREILTFYAGVAEWQESIASELTAWDRIQNVLPSLYGLVQATGSATLSQTAHELASGDSGDGFVREYWDREHSLEVVSPRDFFARVVLQAYAARLPNGLDCPWCKMPPQAGCLTPQGEGHALNLVCSLCLRRRPFPRGRCPGCNEAAEAKLANFTAPAYPHLRLLACETCHGYLHIADLSRDAAAIPEVDELAALPLDLWAIQHGYHKLQPNLAGV